MPEVREREAHDPAFRFRSAGERQQIIRRVLAGIVRRRMLRRRVRLPLARSLR